ncbi:MAG TPA: glycosyltransferase family 4 protein [Polyangiaceae bacterium]|nr:glycosyltransferase family 4 protein [Polyangiaceae bacterium]
MRVLFLATNPPSTEASTRYRIAQYFPALYAAGHSPTLSTFFGDPDARPRWARVGGGLVQRAVDIARAGSFDVAVIHRELLPHAWNQPVFLLREQVPIVFDFDDTVFLQMRTGWRHTLSCPESTRRLVAAACVVFAGNDYLAEYARSFSNRVEILPTVVDTRAYRPSPRAATDVPVVGWVGSPTTAQYLEPVLPVLDELAREFRFRLRIVGAGRAIRMNNIEVECPAWHADDEAALFRDLDIGLYPLVDDAWTRGKCGFKAIQYMASGVASVVSPVGVVRQIVRDGIDGIWADTPAQWRCALADLLRNVDARVRMGAEGRARIEAAYSLAAVAPRFIAGLERAAATQAR